MDFLKWLIIQLIALVQFCWNKRAKSYVRVSLALIVGGIAVLSAPPIVLLLQFLKIVVAPTGPDSPWWMDPATGLFVVVLGVGIFVVFYWMDPDRLKVTPPPPSLTITPGAGWTFEQTVLMIGEISGSPVVLENFPDAERSAAVRSQQLRAPTAEELLRDTRAIIIGGTVPAYDVLPQGGTIIVRRK